MILFAIYCAHGATESAPNKEQERHKNVQVINKEISEDQITLDKLAVAYNRKFSTSETAMAILREVLKCRRGAGRSCCTADAPCTACNDAHLSKIVAKIEQGQPISFVLPAFPGKSPNLGKVLGILPDMAERCALQFLQQLAERIGRIYKPGAHIILASDGRVFSDVVGMRDEDVSTYRDELRAMIAEMGLNRISTFNLEELYEDASFDEMRAQMMDTFGPSIEDMRASVKRAAKDPAATDDDRELNRLYCGITRFLVEDASFPGQTLSRNAIQKKARVRAYQVIQRSQAWSGLVEEYFSDAVRLSIHPHGCGSKKLGIHFIPTANGDNWMTPWHAVALETEAGSFMLVRRSAAEEMGARLVYQSGRPSHYTMV